jgi:DNA replication protein DnaC
LIAEDGGSFPVVSSPAVPVEFSEVRRSGPSRIGKILKSSVLTTERLVKGMEASGALFLSNGMVQEAALAVRQARGGDCPVCRRPYVKTRTKNGFADFEWYRPDCDCEQTEDERRTKIAEIDARMVLAGVPDEYRRSTFEGDSFGWDYGAEDRTNQAMRGVYQFAKDRDYKKRGLVLYGDVGTGKTRCAVGVLRRAAIDGLDVQFVKMAEIVGRFADRERGKRFVDGLLGRDVVLFDDLDKIGSLENTWVAEQVFRVFDGLLGSGRKILGTSNLPDYDAFVKKFGEPVMSRLLGGCMFVEFRGSDYRIRRADMERKNREAGGAAAK